MFTGKKFSDILSEFEIFWSWIKFIHHTAYYFGSVTAASAILKVP